MPDESGLHVTRGPLTAHNIFEGLLDRSNDYAFVLMDPQGRIVGWRGAAPVLFGYTEAEMLGRLIDEIFTNEDRALGLPVHERVVAGADSRSEDDRWHIRKDGTRVWITGTVEKVVDDRGAIVGFSKVMRDRTDFRAYMEATENRLQALTQKHEATNVFFARLVHEIRNVLSPMASIVEILRRTTDQPTELPVAVLGRQLSLLTRMMDDVMALAASEAQHLQLNLSHFDIAQELLSVVPSLMEQAQRKHQQMQVFVPPGAVLCRQTGSAFSKSSSTWSAMRSSTRLNGEVFGSSARWSLSTSLFAWRTPASGSLLNYYRRSLTSLHVQQ